MLLMLALQVLLLDEITVDMDVLGRLDLLNFLKEESERQNATILYATHIFDGLEPWITHVAHVADGKLVRGEKDIHASCKQCVHIVLVMLIADGRQTSGRPQCIARDCPRQDVCDQCGHDVSRESLNVVKCTQFSSAWPL